MQARRTGWRRTVAGLALVLALGLLATRTCQNELATAEIRIRIGEAGAALQEVRVEMLRGDDPEVLAYSEWRLGEAGAGEVVGPWSLRADGGMVRMEITARPRPAAGAGTGAITVSRAVELVDGASITIDIADELARALDARAAEPDR